MKYILTFAFIGIAIFIVKYVRFDLTVTKDGEKKEDSDDITVYEKTFRVKNPFKRNK